jgi:hypothetical protein
VAISEHDRYELQKWFVENAGERVAETLMAHLPPVGWADVATKRDLEHLEMVVRLELRAESNARRADMHELRGELHQLRADVNEKLRAHLVGVMGLNISLAAALIAFLR